MRCESSCHDWCFNSCPITACPRGLGPKIVPLMIDRTVDNICLFWPVKMSYLYTFTRKQARVLCLRFNEVCLELLSYFTKSISHITWSSLIWSSCSDNNTVHVMHVKSKCADPYRITWVVIQLTVRFVVVNWDVTSKPWDNFYAGIYMWVYGNIRLNAITFLFGPVGSCVGSCRIL